MQQILENLYLAPNPSTRPWDDASGTSGHRGHALRLSVAGELALATVDSLRNCSASTRG
jgi:hypothetical protein